jgi:hypothetical protein
MRRVTAGYGLLVVGLILLLPAVTLYVVDGVRRRQFEATATDVGWAVGTFQNLLRKRAEEGHLPSGISPSSEFILETSVGDFDSFHYQTWQFYEKMEDATSERKVPCLQIRLDQERHIIRGLPALMVAFHLQSRQSALLKLLDEAFQERGLRYVLGSASNPE